jgi:hypothetical protein
VLIYRQVQHGGVRRATLHAAGWISFALVVMSLAPSLSRAEFRYSSEECRQQAEAAIGAVHDTTGAGEALVDQLAQSTHVHTIICTTEQSFGGNDAFDKVAASLPGIGSDTTTFWNPIATEIFPDCKISDAGCGVARDPIAELQHEFVHATFADAGERSEDTIPGDTDYNNDGTIKPIPRQDIDATMSANEYCEAAGTCDQRANYGDATVPPPHQVPETGSSILMLLIGIGALWCFRRFLRLA